VLASPIRSRVRYTQLTYESSGWILDRGGRVSASSNCRGADYKHVAHGCIAVAGLELAERLRRIFEALTALISEHGPGEIAVERVFVNRNVESALKLGLGKGSRSVRRPGGVSLCSNTPPAPSSSPSWVLGAAEKAQVGHMIKTLLQLSEKLSPDASDALGDSCVSCAHAQAASVGIPDDRIDSRPHWYQDTALNSLVEVGGVGYEIEAPDVHVLPVAVRGRGKSFF